MDTRHRVDALKAVRGLNKIVELFIVVLLLLRYEITRHGSMWRDVWAIDRHVLVVLL